MKTLKESLLDDEDILVNTDIFLDPKYFKEELNKFKDAGHMILGRSLSDIIDLCETIYDIKAPETPTDEQCRNIVNSSNTYNLLNLKKADESSIRTENYIIRILCQMVHQARGKFWVHSPMIENHHFNRADNDKHEQLSWEGEQAWKTMWDLEGKMIRNKIPNDIVDVMDEMGLLDSDVSSYKNTTRYRVTLYTRQALKERSFKLIWIPSNLKSEYKKLLEIILTDL